MDWIDENLPDDLAIAVVNETGSRTTANVGCRTGGDVLFVDRVTLDPGARREWSESVDGPVEIGVQVRDGPEATERFDPTDGSGRVAATITAGSVSFSTAGGRGGVGQRGTGGVDSFAAAETSGGGFGDDGGPFGGDDAVGADRDDAVGADRDDGWGFGDDGTDAGGTWGFDDAPTGEGASAAGDGGIDGGDATASASTSRSASGSGAAADSGWGFGDEGEDPDDVSSADGDHAEPSTTAGAEDEPAGRTAGATPTDGNRGDARTGADAAGDAAASRPTGTREPESDERHSGGESPGAGPGSDSGDREGDDEEASDSRGATADSARAEPDRSGGRDASTDANADVASGRPDETRGGTSRTAGADEMYCSSCGSVIKEQAELCPECGVRQSDTSASASGSKDKTSAALLAIFLGFIGAHHFYLGNTGRGILYLLLSWTFIPATIALIEAVIYLTKSEEEFQRQYGG
ncbi:NINE protein [Halobaculum halobium]|uniref:NINE protein n=1 Tax=Halobaculum halobium TaxID=3032281 RepID=A0ABD5TFK3_9EURY|nr:NINE protein [Halobaculum sp. SYNS20]